MLASCRGATCKTTQSHPHCNYILELTAKAVQAKSGLHKDEYPLLLQISLQQKPASFQFHVFFHLLMKLLVAVKFVIHIDAASVYAFSMRTFALIGILRFFACLNHSSRVASTSLWIDGLKRLLSTVIGESESYVWRFPYFSMWYWLWFSKGFVS